MSYRDESEALRVQLAEKDAEIARLRAELDASDSSSAPIITTSARAGGPARVELLTSVDGELSPSDHGAVLSSVEAAFGRSAIPSASGPSHLFTISPRSGRDLQVSVTPRHGRTEIRLTERFTRLMGALYGIGGLMGGMGALVAWLLALDRDHVFSRPMATYGAIAWLGAVWVGVRLLYGAIARSRVSDDRLVHASAVGAVRTAIAARPRVRVEAEPVDDEVEARASTAGVARRSP